MILLKSLVNESRLNDAVQGNTLDSEKRVALNSPFKCFGHSPLRHREQLLLDPRISAKPNIIWCNHVLRLAKMQMNSWGDDPRGRRITKLIRCWKTERRDFVTKALAIGGQSIAQLGSCWSPTPYQINSVHLPPVLVDRSPSPTNGIASCFPGSQPPDYVPRPLRHRRASQCPCPVLALRAGFARYCP